MISFSLRHFKRSDWGWLQGWFQDETTNRELGPLDDEWLEHVLSDKKGVHLVAEENGEPLAIIGVTWGDEKHPSHAITGLAVHPDKRRTGIGSKVLAAVLNWDGHPPNTRWIAFADPENIPPQKMLTSLNWREFEHDAKMLGFEFHVRG